MERDVEGPFFGGGKRKADRDYNSLVFLLLLLPLDDKRGEHLPFRSRSVPGRK